MTTTANTSSEIKQPRTGMVHFVLSHSYTVFFGAVLLGLVFDILIPVALFSNLLFQYVGLAMIVFGSILIYWAQASSSSSRKKMEKENEQRNFESGPYRYSRNPTHIGLTSMTLGLGFILSSFFSVVFVIIASLVTKHFFLRKEEILLEERYGQAYRDYKKKVNTWV
jgi:protein-S-isoprenylcysteine O-methyltransferase Ste14